MTTLRDATTSDIDAITAIYGWSVENETASYELEAPNTAVMLARLKAIQSHGFPYLVAVREGQVVGFAYASAFRSRPGYRFTAEDTIYVARDARGAKVGRALLGELVRRCEGRELRQMLAVIGGKEPEPSIALHAAFGFREVGRLPDVGRKFGEWHDVIVLQRALAYA